MPPHLTRHVFRRLLANEPIVHRGCLRRQASTAIVPRQRKDTPTQRSGPDPRLQPLHRRSIFNFAMFRKKREPAEANMHPGLDKMMELEKMQRLQARLPQPEQVVEALLRFFRWIKKVDRAIMDNQAKLALQSWKYCTQCDHDRRASGLESAPLVTEGLLWQAANALKRGDTHTEPSSALVQLTKAVYDEARLRDNVLTTALCLNNYIRTLSWRGFPRAALDAVTDFEQSAGIVGATEQPQLEPAEDLAEEAPGDQELDFGQQLDVDDTRYTLLARTRWNSVLTGFAKFGTEAEVQEILGTIVKRGHKTASTSATMLDFSLAKQDPTSALRWWNDLRASQRAPPAVQRLIVGKCRTLLMWCLQHSELEIGHEIVRDLTTTSPPKRIWDSIFVWAAGTKKSVDEIDRMIGIMVQSNETIEDRSDWRLPDTGTINSLVDFAISQDDPYMAERFIALGRERDIEPNARTYVLQMSYRLKVGDVDGALIAYKNLQAMDLSSDEDVPVVNRLIVALCGSQRHDFDTIMNVAADLSDRRVRFEPETVATLGLLHLRRDERNDVIDLLNTHAYHFSSTERESIRSTMLEFALDPKTPTSGSWDAYTILRELFDEMPRTQRTELMTSFFRRERPDMGVLIFQNMRMHSRADTMPTIDTYVSAFMALAKHREIDSLEVVHNQLKLDYNINPSTYLLNALIVAYTACGKPRKALDFWDEIAVSREGPSYNSIHVALRACEKAAFGDLKAQEIWGILRRRGIELDQSLWASYVAALAGNGDNDVAFRILEKGVQKGEVEVDESVLGNLFAGGAGQVKQEEIELWARERHPAIWEALERRGVETDLAGMRAFKIDRSVAP